MPFIISAYSRTGAALISWLRPQLAAFTYLLPVPVTVLGIALLGEHGSALQIVGGVLALAGVYWVESSRGE